MGTSDNTAKEQPKHGAEHLAKHKFKPGQSGNPLGRPKGARSKLSESFLADALEAWENNGKEALAEMAREKPGDFAKMIAQLVPKEIDLSSSDGTMTPQQTIYQLPDNGRGDN